MLFKAPKLVHQTNASLLPTENELSMGFCGIHRGTIDDVLAYTPHLECILRDAPVPLDDYEIDIKVHMLKRGQYPCIPNWHCDNVPRDASGKLQYDAVDPNAPPMYLWVSGKPTTEFMRLDEAFDGVRSHGDLADAIDGNFISTVKVPERTWVQMDQRTPHRGTAATEDCWRVFVRLTPKVIVTARPVLSTLRRHTQVYLPSDFHW